MAVDCVVYKDVYFVDATPMTTEQASLYVMRNKGLAHILVLSSDDESLVLVRMSGNPWSYFEAEAEAKSRGYRQFAYVNEDGSKSAGVLTGSNVFHPVTRRHLAIVA